MDVEVEEASPGETRAKTLIWLWIFLCLSIAASWTVWLWPLHKQGSLFIAILGWRLDVPFILVKLVIGNCVPGIIAIVFASREKEQLRHMLSSLARWRVPFKWYLFSVILACGVFWVCLGAVLFYLPTRHPSPSPLAFLRVFLMTLPFGPLFEELAWRAYALTKLQAHYRRLPSALFLGVYWAVWHIPLWLVTLNLRLSIGILVLVMASINLVAWSVIFAFVYNRSAQSLPVVICLHASYVAASTSVFAAVPHAHLYLIGFSAVVSVCVAATLASLNHESV